MRATAIILAVVCLAAIVLTGYIYFTANVYITDIECVAEEAAGQEELFGSLKAAAEKGICTGTLFSGGEIGDAADYQFYTYTVHLQNATFVTAEVAEVQVTPMSADVLQTEQAQPISIPARGAGPVRATILTKRDMHNVRELTVTYYLWGMPFSLKTTYSK